MKKIHVQYIDGSSAYFNAVGYEHNKDHNMFFVNTEKQRIMIPDVNVREIGFVKYVNGVMEYE